MICTSQIETALVVENVWKERYLPSMGFGDLKVRTVPAGGVVAAWVANIGFWLIVGEFPNRISTVLKSRLSSLGFTTRVETKYVFWRSAFHQG